MVRWSTATRMFVAWGLTLPAAGLVGAGAESLTKQGTWGTITTGVLLVAGAGVIWTLSRRRPVTVDNVNDVESESAGVVTTAIAAVIPPPAGPVVTAPAPDRNSGPTAEPTSHATV